MNSIKKNIILTILLITLFALNEGASAMQIAFLYHPTNAPETPQISNDIRNDIQVIEYCTDMHYKYLPWIDGTEPYCCLHWNNTGCTVFTPDCKDYVADFICDEEKLPLALFDRKLFCYYKSLNRIIAITAKECKYQIVSPQLVSSSENLYFISMHQYGTLFVVSQGKPDFYNMQIKILQNGVVKEGPVGYLPFWYDNDIIGFMRNSKLWLYKISEHIESPFLDSIGIQISCDASPLWTDSIWIDNQRKHLVYTVEHPEYVFFLFQIHSFKVDIACLSLDNGDKDVIPVGKVINSIIMVQ